MTREWKQTIVGAIVLGLVCAYVVWMLERFNRERLIADFHAQLEKLPTFKQPGEAA